MPELRVVTAREVGLTGNDIIRISLERIVELGGEAPMAELYPPIEARMSGARLSDVGRAYVRSRVNRIAVRARTAAAPPKSSSSRLDPAARQVYPILTTLV